MYPTLLTLWLTLSGLPPRAARPRPRPAFRRLVLESLEDRTLPSTLTVTNADLLLGYLTPEYFAGGTIAIDVAAARAALGRLADTVSLPLISVAWGIHDIVNESMASAARVIGSRYGSAAHQQSVPRPQSNAVPQRAQASRRGALEAVMTEILKLS